MGYAPLQKIIPFILTRKYGFEGALPLFRKIFPFPLIRGRG